MITSYEEMAVIFVKGLAPTWPLTAANIEIPILRETGGYEIQDYKSSQKVLISPKIMHSS